MHASTFHPRLPILALLLCGALAPVPAWAAATTDRAELATLAERHRQERAACLTLQDAEARADCARDAGAAYAHAKRNRPSDIDPPFAKNALRRCEALTGDENRDCMARMNGQGTTSGSVAGGGIYRELVVVETIAPPSGPTAATEPVMPKTPVTPMTATPPTPAPATTPSAVNSPTPK